VKVYFCDPQSPWQRGTNENTNGLLRQYFPKKTDLSGYTQADLNKVALRLNQRPRQTLGFETPASKLQASVASTGWAGTAIRKCLGSDPQPSYAGSMIAKSLRVCSELHLMPSYCVFGREMALSWSKGPFLFRPGFQLFEVLSFIFMGPPVSTYRGTDFTLCGQNFNLWGQPQLLDRAVRDRP